MLWNLKKQNKYIVIMCPTSTVHKMGLMHIVDIAACILVSAELQNRCMLQRPKEYLGNAP